ncbi:hypothetical protein GMRT_13191 [Giardia muris]|uniref:Uncharacterized protein n=1 Tax=Giardia muris TaxID=5742 RepID=A0A4Z1SRZ4_GIAMU|nr:hypothetical protein GMRT_13191 [Giardia muris]|eukprot:TNJ28666.1 hypothetical protein GMRT_13191 [Giardia muris]
MSYFDTDIGARRIDYIGDVASRHVLSKSVRPGHPHAPVPVEVKAAIADITGISGFTSHLLLDPNRPPMGAVCKGIYLPVVRRSSIRVGPTTQSNPFFSTTDSSLVAGCRIANAFGPLARGWKVAADQTTAIVLCPSSVARRYLYSVGEHTGSTYNYLKTSGSDVLLVFNTVDLSLMHLVPLSAYQGIGPCCSLSLLPTEITEAYLSNYLQAGGTGGQIPLCAAVLACYDGRIYLCVAINRRLRYIQLLTIIQPVPHLFFSTITAISLQALTDANANIGDKGPQLALLVAGPLAFSTPRMSIKGLWERADRLPTPAAAIFTLSFSTSQRSLMVTSRLTVTSFGNLLVESLPSHLLSCCLVRNAQQCPFYMASSCSEVVGILFNRRGGSTISSMRSYCDPAETQRGPPTGDGTLKPTGDQLEKLRRQFAKTIVPLTSGARYRTHILMFLYLLLANAYYLVRFCIDILAFVVRKVAKTSTSTEVVSDSYVVPTRICLAVYDRPGKSYHLLLHMSNGALIGAKTMKVNAVEAVQMEKKLGELGVALTSLYLFKHEAYPISGGLQINDICVWPILLCNEYDEIATRQTLGIQLSHLLDCSRNPSTFDAEGNTRESLLASSIVIAEDPAAQILGCASYQENTDALLQDLTRHIRATPSARDSGLRSTSNLEERFMEQVPILFLACSSYSDASITLIACTLSANPSVPFSSEYLFDVSTLEQVDYPKLYANGLCTQQVTAIGKPRHRCSPLIHDSSAYDQIDSELGQHEGGESDIPMPIGVTSRTTIRRDRSRQSVYDPVISLGIHLLPSTLQMASPGRVFVDFSSPLTAPVSSRGPSTPGHGPLDPEGEYSLVMLPIVRDIDIPSCGVGGMGVYTAMRALPLSLGCPASLGISSFEITFALQKTSYMKRVVEEALKARPESLEPMQRAQDLLRQYHGSRKLTIEPVPHVTDDVPMLSKKLVVDYTGALLSLLQTLPFNYALLDTVVITFEKGPALVFDLLRKTPILQLVGRYAEVRMLCRQLIHSTCKRLVVLGLQGETARTVALCRFLSLIDLLGIQIGLTALLTRAMAKAMKNVEHSINLHWQSSAATGKEMLRALEQDRSIEEYYLHGPNDNASPYFLSYLTLVAYVEKLTGLPCGDDLSSESPTGTDAAERLTRYNTVTFLSACRRVSDLVGHDVPCIPGFLGANLDIFVHPHRNGGAHAFTEVDSSSPAALSHQVRQRLYYQAIFLFLQELRSTNRIFIRYENLSWQHGPEIPLLRLCPLSHYIKDSASSETDRIRNLLLFTTASNLLNRADELISNPTAEDQKTARTVLCVELCDALLSAALGTQDAKDLLASTRTPITCSQEIDDDPIDICSPHVPLEPARSTTVGFQDSSSEVTHLLDSVSAYIGMSTTIYYFFGYTFDASRFSVTFKSVPNTPHIACKSPVIKIESKSTPVSRLQDTVRPKLDQAHALIREYIKRYLSELVATKLAAGSVDGLSLLLETVVHSDIIDILSMPDLSVLYVRIKGYEHLKAYLNSNSQVSDYLALVLRQGTGPSSLSQRSMPRLVWQEFLRLPPWVLLFILLLASQSTNKDGYSLEGPWLDTYLKTISNDCTSQEGNTPNLDMKALIDVALRETLDSFVRLFISDVRNESYTSELFYEALVPPLQTHFLSHCFTAIYHYFACAQPRPIEHPTIEAVIPSFLLLETSQTSSQNQNRGIPLLQTAIRTSSLVDYVSLEQFRPLVCFLYLVAGMQDMSMATSSLLSDLVSNILSGPCRLCTSAVSLQRIEELYKAMRIGSEKVVLSPLTCLRLASTSSHDDIYLIFQKYVRGLLRQQKESEETEGTIACNENSPDAGLQALLALTKQGCVFEGIDPLPAIVLESLLEEVRRPILFVVDRFDYFDQAVGLFFRGLEEKYGVVEPEESKRLYGELLKKLTFILSVLNGIPMPSTTHEFSRYVAALHAFAGLRAQVGLLVDMGEIYVQGFSRLKWICRPLPDSPLIQVLRDAASIELSIVSLWEEAYNYFLDVAYYICNGFAPPDPTYLPLPILRILCSCASVLGSNKDTVADCLPKFIGCVAIVSLFCYAPLPEGATYPSQSSSGSLYERIVRLVAESKYEEETVVPTSNISLSSLSLSRTLSTMKGDVFGIRDKAANEIFHNRYRRQGCIFSNVLTAVFLCEILRCNICGQAETPIGERLLRLCVEEPISKLSSSLQPIFIQTPILSLLTLSPPGLEDILVTIALRYKQGPQPGILLYLSLIGSSKLSLPVLSPEMAGYYASSTRKELIVAACNLLSLSIPESSIRQFSSTTDPLYEAFLLAMRSSPHEETVLSASDMSLADLLMEAPKTIIPVQPFHTILPLPFLPYQEVEVLVLEAFRSDTSFMGVAAKNQPAQQDIDTPFGKVCTQLAANSSDFDPQVLVQAILNVQHEIFSMEGMYSTVRLLHACLRANCDRLCQAIGAFLDIYLKYFYILSKYCDETLEPILTIYTHLGELVSRFGATQFPKELLIRVAASHITSSSSSEPSIIRFLFKQVGGTPLEFLTELLPFLTPLRKTWFSSWISEGLLASALQIPKETIQKELKTLYEAAMLSPSEPEVLSLLMDYFGLSERRQAIIAYQQALERVLVSAEKNCDLSECFPILFTIIGILESDDSDTEEYVPRLRSIYLSFVKKLIETCGTDTARMVRVISTLSDIFLDRTKFRTDRYHVVAPLIIGTTLYAFTSSSTGFTLSTTQMNQKQIHDTAVSTIRASCGWDSSDDEPRAPIKTSGWQNSDTEEEPVPLKYSSGNKWEVTSEESTNDTQSKPLSSEPLNVSSVVPSSIIDAIGALIEGLAANEDIVLTTTTACLLYSSLFQPPTVRFPMEVRCSLLLRHRPAMALLAGDFLLATLGYQFGCLNAIHPLLSTDVQAHVEVSGSETSAHKCIAGLIACIISVQHPSESIPTWLFAEVFGRGCPRKYVHAARRLRDASLEAIKTRGLIVSCSVDQLLRVCLHEHGSEYTIMVARALISLVGDFCTLLKYKLSDEADVLLPLHPSASHFAQSGLRLIDLALAEAISSGLIPGTVLLAHACLVAVHDISTNNGLEGVERPLSRAVESYVCRSVSLTVAKAIGDNIGLKSEVVTEDFIKHNLEAVLQYCRALCLSREALLVPLGGAHHRSNIRFVEDTRSLLEQAIETTIPAPIIPDILEYDTMVKLVPYLVQTVIRLLVESREPDKYYLLFWEVVDLHLRATHPSDPKKTLSRLEKLLHGFDTDPEANDRLLVIYLSFLTHPGLKKYQALVLDRTLTIIKTAAIMSTPVYNPQSYSLILPPCEYLANKASIPLPILLALKGTVILDEMEGTDFQRIILGLPDISLDALYDPSPYITDLLGVEYAALATHFRLYTGGYKQTQPRRLLDFSKSVISSISSSVYSDRK